MGNDERFSQDVLRAVFERLDSVFPEFGFRRRRGGWVATNEAFCREKFDVRCDRIICNIDTGYYIHGTGRGEHWLAYLNGGVFPRGSAWHEAATELARRVGMEGFVRRASEESVWSRVVAAAQRQFADAKWAHEYLRGRGIDGERWGLGAVSSPGQLLKEAGLSVAEARAQRVLTSAPGEDWWTGRIVGLVRDAGGDAVGLWGRLAGPGQGPRYLMGGVGSPAFYGSARGARVVLVEGFFDGLRLKEHGEVAVALGGTAMSDEALETLSAATEIVVCLDGDDAGVEGTKRLLRQLPMKAALPPVTVVQLPVDSDVDEVLREEPGAWPGLLRGRVPWLTFVVRSVLEPVVGGDTPADEQLALRRVGAVCRAAKVGWPAEVAVALREAAKLVHVDERFLLRVIDAAQ